MYKGTLTVCLALLLAACSSMSQEAPYNCANAERDIKKLEANILAGSDVYPDPYINQAKNEIDRIKYDCGL